MFFCVFSVVLIAQKTWRNEFIIANVIWWIHRWRDLTILRTIVLRKNYQVTSAHVLWHYFRRETMFRATTCTPAFIYSQWTSMHYSPITQTFEYSPAKFANFVYFCITHGKVLPLCWIVVTLFPAQYKSIQNSQTLHYYVFDILQYSATKLHNFTKFRKLFPIVLKLFWNLKFVYLGNGPLNIASFEIIQ